MTETQRLVKCLDSDHWCLLNAIADSYEESGDTVMASGYRWFAALRKFPAGDRGRWFWMSPRMPRRSGEVVIKPEKEGGANSRMPWAIFEATKKDMDIGCNPGEFRTLAKCYEVGARAVGEYLLTEEGRASQPKTQHAG